MDDLISRQAAISGIVGMTTMSIEELANAGNKERFDWIKGLSDSLVKIINLPSAEPERETGRWIPLATWKNAYRCSECGRTLTDIIDGKNNVTKSYPYCHCGAKMEVEQDG